MGVGITRPYVGQNARSFEAVKVGDKKPDDVTSPPKPEVLRAWAFERAADGSRAVPPPPRGAPGRDPLVIELGQIEVGTRIELISLSDDPSAEFTSRCKSAIFELPLTGYDVAGRVGTIALDEKQMKEKGVAAGERFLLRQVDEDGNASLPVHVHLDPNGWAGGAQLDEPTKDGGTQRVQGRAIDIAVGVMGLPGAADQGRMEQVLGKVTTDQHAPVLVEGNISVVTEQLDKKEREILTGYAAAMSTLIGGGSTPRAQIKQQLDANPTWADHAQYKPHVELLRRLIDDDSPTFEKLARLTNAAAGSGATDSIEWNQANAMAQNPPSSMTLVQFAKAVEPGVTLTVQNSRTGESSSITQSDEARSAAILLRDVKNGDPLIVTYHDNPPGQEPNHGKPFGFRYDANSKDGKARSNPLDIRLGAFNLKTTKATQDG